MHLLSDKLAAMIESHTELITKRWLAEIQTDRTMSSFTDDNIDYVKSRVSNILFNLREWIGYDTSKIDIGRRYACEGDPSVRGCAVIHHSQEDHLVVLHQ